MTERSSVHFYLDWTKQRIDEMDATLASLEAEAGRMKADARTNADQLIADLKRRRDEFQAKAKAGIEAGEAALQAAKAQLEAQWPQFEAQLRTYFATTGKQIEQQQAAFRDAAAAQAKAWQAAAESLQGEATRLAAARRADVDAAVQRMKATAADAEARLEKLKQAGGESWAALSAALGQSRKAFDQASQAAWDALRRAQS